MNLSMIILMFRNFRLPEIKESEDSPSDEKQGETADFTRICSLGYCCKHYFPVQSEVDVTESSYFSDHTFSTQITLMERQEYRVAEDRHRLMIIPAINIGRIFDACLAFWVAFVLQQELDTEKATIAWNLLSQSC